MKTSYKLAATPSHTHTCTVCQAEFISTANSSLVYGFKNLSTSLTAELESHSCISHPTPNHKHTCTLFQAEFKSAANSLLVYGFKILSTSLKELESHSCIIRNPVNNIQMIECMHVCMYASKDIL